MLSIRRLLALFASCLAIACSGPTTLGTGSTGTTPDAGATSPLPDAGTTPADAGTNGGNGPGGEVADAGTGGGGSGGDVADAGSGGGGAADAGGGDTGSADAGNAGGGGTADAGTAGGGGTPDAGTGGGASTGPERLTTGASAVALAIDANNVYFLDNAGTTDAVRSVPKSGGATATLSDGRAARSLIATGDAVLWEGLDGSDWAIFESDGGSVHRVAPLLTGGGLAASATTAFSRSSNVETSRWDLLGCARDGSGCTRIVTDNPLVPPVYFDSGKLYFIQQPTDTDFGPISTLESYDPAADPFHTFGFMTLQNAQDITGLRVNGSLFAVRSRGNVWAGRFGSTFAMIRAAAAGDDVDISHGLIYWNESGCLGSANIDGSGATCLDQGHEYAGVRVDETAVYFIRDGDIFRIAK